MSAVWQTIETAPICKSVIVYGGAGVRFAYQDEFGQWRNMLRAPVNYRVTHWMPLPDPPATPPPRGSIVDERA